MKFKKECLALLFIFQLITVPILAQSQFIGEWKGAFVREGSIQLTELTFFIENDSLKGYHHIPERELYDEPITEIEQRADTLFFRSRYGPFWLISNNHPDQLLGMSVRWNPKIKLHLKRHSLNALYHDTREYSVNNGENNLTGKVYIPAKEFANNKLIVLIHGSGPVLMEDRCYRTEAIALAKRGYHVAVYDKRGSGASTGNLSEASIGDLASDAVVILNEMKQQFGPDFKYGFLGISQGGWVATNAANQTNASDFLILNVGPAVSIWQQELDRVKYTMLQQEYSDAAIDSALSHVELMFQLVNDSTLWPEYIRSSKEINDLGLDEIVNTRLEIYDRHVSWWRINNYDPKEDLMNMKIPVLSLMGAKDPLVPPGTNQKLMDEFLSKSESPFYDIKVFDNVYHGLESYSDFRGTNWEWPSSYWVWPYKAEGLYDTINDFFKRIEK